MLELESIAFSYDRQPFLEGVSLRFEAGKITTIIGPNGCGKSTVLKLGSRLLLPRTGRVLLDGQDISRMSRKVFARRVSVLLQNNAPPHMSVEQAVMFGRYPYQAFAQPLSDEDRRLAGQAMKTTGCEAFRGKAVSRLSGGERQRVFLAMVLAQDTDVIFLDEPTTYLDIHVCYDIMELIVRLNRELGKTIVLVLHDLNLALNYSHSIVLMEKGRIISHDTPQTTACGDGIRKVFGVNLHRVLRGTKTYYCFDKL